MLHVEIHQMLHDSSGDRPELVAAFDVDQRGLHDPCGYGVEAVRTVSVIDPETGEVVLSDSDALRWAQLLPLALRAGDLSVRVETRATVTGVETPVTDPISAIVQEVGGGNAATAH